VGGTLSPVGESPRFEMSNTCIAGLSGNGSGRGAGRKCVFKTVQAERGFVQCCSKHLSAMLTTAIHLSAMAKAATHRSATAKGRGNGP